MSGARATVREREQDLAERLERARRAGACAAYSKRAFERILLQIGLEKYEKAILPLEIMEDYPCQGAKIIQFPGGKA